jgi:cardiolipin synthase
MPEFFREFGLFCWTLKSGGFWQSVLWLWQLQNAIVGIIKEIDMNQYTLFTKVQDYYTDLVEKLAAAQRSISMTYLSFDSGEWSEQISQVLIAKAAEGVGVRLMVDELGQLLDEPRHALDNLALFNHLRSHGIQVDIFRPVSPLQANNRMHCKIAAIDNHMVFLGGSNIGDYYTTWTDTNLRVDGELGNVFHAVYDFLNGHSQNGKTSTRSIDTKNLTAGNNHLWLTIPHQQYDIRDALMKLIQEADKSIFIRTWYFLPDDEMLKALCEKARNGVRVNVLLSHETRVRPVDFANYIHVHKLVCTGGNVYRYAGKYMHSKAAWNNKGDVLFGSANLDPTSMHNNFESCLQIHDARLVWELRRSFYADLATSPKQTPESYLRRSLANKALTHACNLVSSWL